MIGPSACSPHCISCGDAIHDDAPDQTDAWLAGMCEPCHEADTAIVDNSDFYGGDSAGSYGPSDPRFNERA